MLKMSLKNNRCHCIFWLDIVQTVYICYNSITDTGLLLSIHSHKIIWLVVSKTTDVTASVGWALPKQFICYNSITFIGFLLCIHSHKIIRLVPRPTKTQCTCISPAHQCTYPGLPRHKHTYQRGLVWLT